MNDPSKFLGGSGGLPPSSGFILLPSGQVMQVATSSNAGNIIQAPIRPQMQAPTKSEPGMNYINQLDGASRILDEESGSGSSNAAGSTKQPRKLTEKKKVKKIPQLDGGPGMTDSSSEEDLDDEEDDPLRRIANRIGDDGHDEDEEHVVEEDPLNSDDDQSDDEDLQTLFESNNVIVCQFEKVGVSQLSSFKKKQNF